jgi:acetoin utilization deacetylase AcuC-like enzyme
MKIVTDPRCTEYSHPGHPERPERIKLTTEKLRKQAELPIVWTRPNVAEEAQLLRAHTAEHLARLKDPEDFDMDTPFIPGISEHARLSAGAGVDCMRSASTGQNAFSLMRPPGHHATRTRAMGFCYLNNMAIAALEALAAGTNRIAILDFDVHHGNGTEAILSGHPGAWFASVHQFPCYPGTGTRNVGNNCFNYPMPPGSGRIEYREALSSALDHLTQQDPSLLGVSAGFDCYVNDPLAQEPLEKEDFYWLGERIRKLGLPVFSLLEGGYSADLPDLILAYLKGLEGK